MRKSSLKILSNGNLFCWKIIPISLQQPITEVMKHFIIYGLAGVLGTGLLLAGGRLSRSLRQGITARPAGLDPGFGSAHTNLRGVTTSATPFCISSPVPRKALVGCASSLEARLSPLSPGSPWPAPAVPPGCPLILCFYLRCTGGGYRCTRCLLDPVSSPNTPFLCTAIGPGILRIIITFSTESVET